VDLTDLLERGDVRICERSRALPSCAGLSWFPVRLREPLAGTTAQRFDHEALDRCILGCLVLLLCGGTGYLLDSHRGVTEACAYLIDLEPVGSTLLTFLCFIRDGRRADLLLDPLAKSTAFGRGSKL
jgi:hypothetical protein